MSGSDALAREPLDILVGTLRYPPYVAGGYELLTRDAVDALRARGHRVHVLTARGDRFAGDERILPWLEPELDGEDPLAASLHAPLGERLRLHFLRRANQEATARALERVKPDLFLFFNLGLASLAPILAARRAGVVTLGFLSDPWIANYWLLDWEKSGRKPLRRNVLSFFYRRLRSYVGTGSVLCCSRHLLQRLEIDGLERGTGDVLHLGVPPDVEARTRELEIPGRDSGTPLRVGCISALWAGKGQHVLVKALARVREMGHAVELWMAAPSETDAYRSELEALVAGAGIGDAVEFKPELSREALARELALSHVLCVPSVWDEPFPLATLEGLSHGLAVCVSTAGGSPEAIEDGVDGRVFRSEDEAALATVLAAWEGDEPSRLRMAAAGRAKALGALSHDRFVEGLERAMARALGRPSSQTPEGAKR